MARCVFNQFYTQVEATYASAGCQRDGDCVFHAFRLRFGKADSTLRKKLSVRAFSLGETEAGETETGMVKKDETTDGNVASQEPPSNEFAASDVVDSTESVGFCRNIDICCYARCQNEILSFTHWHDGALH